MGFFRYFVGTGALTAGGGIEFTGEEVDYKLMWPLEGHYVFVGPRGMPTVERQSLLDIRLERIFDVRGRSLAISLDVFNIASSEAVTSVNTIVNNGPDYGFSKSYSLFSSGIEPNQFYRAVQERVRPRTIRLGAAWYF